MHTGSSDTAATLQEFCPAVHKNATIGWEEDKLHSKDAQLVNVVTEFRNLISVNKIMRQS